MVEREKEKERKKKKENGAERLPGEEPFPLKGSNSLEK